jgi:hypothetical protein
MSKLNRARKLIGKKIMTDFGEGLPLKVLDVNFLDLTDIQAISQDEHGWIIGWPEKDKDGALYLHLEGATHSEHGQEYQDDNSWHKVNSRVSYKIVE